MPALAGSVRGDYRGTCDRFQSISKKGFTVGFKVDM